MKTLDHPGVINIYDNFQEGGRDFQLVLEYALHGDLHSFIKSNILSYEAKVFYIAQMVEILDYLRDEEVVHRDLKPSNFLLDENWNLKIADFGSA